MTDECPQLQEISVMFTVVPVFGRRYGRQAGKMYWELMQDGDNRNAYLGAGGRLGERD